MIQLRCSLCTWCSYKREDEEEESLRNDYEKHFRLWHTPAPVFVRFVSTDD